MNKGSKVQKLIRLNKKNTNFAKTSTDPLIRELPRFLKKFSEFPTRNLNYEWKTLSDDGFVNWVNSLNKTELIEVNRVKTSYLLRSIEAFQFVSVWRMTDLVSSSVNILNNDMLIAGAATSRSAIELASRYIHAAHFFDKYFREIPWEKLDTHLLILGHLENPQDPKSLKMVEHDIDRLMWGSRLDEVLDFNPELEQKNIITLIEKIDKTIDTGNNTDKIMPHYAILSEAAHPNGLGFKRFQKSSGIEIDEKWISIELTENANAEAAELLRSEIMWGLAFSTFHMARCFQIFYEIGNFTFARMGEVLPGKERGK
jgi:hypothetical protein